MIHYDDDDAYDNDDDTQDRSIFRAITLARGTEGTEGIG